MNGERERERGNDGAAAWAMPTTSGTPGTSDDAAVNGRGRAPPSRFNKYT